MRLVKATEDDNDLLTSFFENTVLPGHIDMALTRPAGFFRQYQLQSDHYSTYMLLNKQDEVKALATVIFRKGWVDGEEQMIGYATDLRVASSRAAILQWSQHFLPALEQERAAHNCKYVFSVVAQGQRQAFNAFIRPRSPKRQMPRYYNFRAFRLVMVHGTYPFAMGPLKSIETKKATEADKQDLFEYILAKKASKPYHFENSVEDLESSIDRWTNLRLIDFWIARDRDGKIIGCAAPWSSQGIQHWIPKSFTPRGKSLQETLQLGSYMRLVHPFGKLNQPINFQFLTHLYADNHDIFHSLLWHCFKQTHRSQFLVYSHFNGDLITAPPKSFIHSTTKANLYSILSPTEPPPDLLRPTAWREPPDFELAFL